MEAKVVKDVSEFSKQKKEEGKKRKNPSADWLGNSSVQWAKLAARR